MIGRTVAVLTCGCIVSLFLSGCKGDTGPAGPPGAGTLSGNLYGRVTLYDEDSTRITDHSGVTISIAGSWRSAVSGRDGWWTIVGVNAGTYTLVFSKPGFGTYKYFGLEFVGGDSLYSGSWGLVNVARYFVDSLSASVGSDSVVRISGTLSSPVPQNDYRYAILFVDTTAAVSPDRYVTTLIAYVGSGTAFSLSESLSDLISYYGILRGSHLWLVAYGWGGSYGGGYYDPTLRRNVFTTLSPTPSRVVDVLLP